MTAIAKSFAAHQSRADERNSRSAWRYAGAGLAIVLLALTMTAAGIRGRSAGQGYTAWPTIEQPISDRNAPPVTFPISPFTGYFGD
jgi:hypothetical protein